MNELRIGIGQINTKVGDIAGNIKKIEEQWTESANDGVDLFVTPELSVSGYPLEDIIENPDLLKQADRGLNYLLELSSKNRFADKAILVGVPLKGEVNEDGRNVYNAAVLIENGSIQHQVRKQKLPTYDVFDERRTLAQGSPSEPVEYKGVKLGVIICEDTWYPEVSAGLVKKGAQAIISINSSPFERGKFERRLENVVRARATESNVPVIYAAQVGGQDEVVFDGASMAVNGDGALMYQAPAFEESMGQIKLSAHAHRPAQIISRPAISQYPKDLEATWKALVLATRDYVEKNWDEHKEVVLGMSGGIDSAVVAAVLADAFGGPRVHAVSMPYKYTSNETRDDARIASKMIDANFYESPIDREVQAHIDRLKTDFNVQAEATLTEENLQSRSRGVKLMALSNANHWLVMSTGNKSEGSVGYCTLYGDTNGGYNPLKDVPKPLVFALAKWRNENYPTGVKGPDGPVMPETIITRPASAELAEEQVDEDTLGDYETELAPVLELYVEQDLSVDQIIQETGLERAYVEDIISKTDIAEFKRRQMCPGPKISPRNFGRGRQNPITKPTTPKMIRDVDELIAGLD
ncbi:MAG: NAD+ synthase [Pseudomonadota bacterium]